MEKIFSNEKEFLAEVQGIEKRTNREDMAIRSVKFGKENDNVAHPFDDNGEFVIKITKNKEKQLIPCRGYAVNTLAQRLGIQGPVLDRMNGKELTDIFKRCAKKFRPEEKMKVIELDGKILAVLSDGYKVIPADTIYDMAKSEVDRIGSTFLEGYVTDDIFAATYRIDNKEVKAAYDDFDELTGDAVPMVAIATSNTGFSSVSITPMFRMRGRDIIIGKALNACHKGSSDEKVIEENLAQIFPLFKEAAETLARLQKVTIEHPEKCILNVADRVHLPRKWVKMAAEELEHLIGWNQTVTAYDIYLALTEVMFHAQNAGSTKAIIDALREQVARVLFVDFKKYDVPYSNYS